jgi:uncharacterized protein YciI
MYIVELALDNNPDRLAARPAHRVRVQQLHSEGVIKLAGPYPDDSGAMLIVDVADDAALQSLLDADPYFRAPGVRIVRIQPWAPIFH